VSGEHKDAGDRFLFAEWPRERSKLGFFGYMGLGLFLAAGLVVNPGNLSVMDFALPVLFLVMAGIRYREWHNNG
jgi:hypothetical protein